MKSTILSSDYFDVIIIGGGPAGLAAANEFLEYEHNLLDKSVLVLDMGPGIPERLKSRQTGDDWYNTHGLGGAGLFSDGKLAFSVSNALNDHITDSVSFYERAFRLFNELDVELQKNQVPEGQIQQLQNAFNQKGILLDYYDVWQIEPSLLPQAIDNLRERLQTGGISILLNTKVLAISDDAEVKQVYCLHKEKEFVFKCKYLILAVGKSGAKWLTEQLPQLGIEASYRPIEIGIRVEVPSDLLEPYINVHRDLKLATEVKRATSVKSFCVCHGGIVTPCHYEGFLVLGGYSGIQKSANTNFALLVRVDQKDIYNTIDYGFSVIKTANILGKGKPLVQLLGDLRYGESSSAELLAANPIQTTLSDYTLANIKLALPSLIIDSLLEGLESFDKVIPGINADGNVVSAPCLDFCYQQVAVDENMESNVDGIFVVGDAAGYAKGILAASAGGILASREIIPRLG